MTRPVVLGTNLRNPPAALGRKALTLHALARAGLPVPSAIGLIASLAVDPKVVRKVANDIGYPVAIRSSANVEDLQDSAAPGLFDSVLNVQSDEALDAAVAQVLASAHTPLVGAYLQARGITTRAQVAIIVQRQVVATAGHGVLYTRPPGQPTATRAIIEIPGKPPLWIERNRAEGPRSNTIPTPSNFPLQAHEVLALWNLALETEKLLEIESGLDIEWIWDETGPHLLQARPIVHRSNSDDQNNSEIREHIAFSSRDSDRVWHLDAVHNPLPLSPAQAGLVQQVRDLAPYDMRIVAGYLYTSKRDGAEEKKSCEESQQQVRLWFSETLAPKMNAALAPIERQGAPRLQDALRCYRKIFHCLTTELSPALATIGETSGGNPLSLWISETLAGQTDTEELLRKVGPMSPAWDVAAPTYGEDPERVKRAIALPLDCAKQHAEAEESLREADDLFFFRAQYVMRRALLSLGARWDIGDDIFNMPLSTLLSEQHRDCVPLDLQEVAEKARETTAEQRKLKMPLSFSGGVALSSKIPTNSELWRGVGTGGYVEGNVLRVSQLRNFPEILARDRVVLVLPTVTPAHALAARGAVAVVCEYGDHLGHGAAMARELAIPCVVGCRQAWRELKTGEKVGVHGDAGLVARLATAP